MATLKISDETKTRLDPMRHPGQSWDGYLQEVAGLAEKARKENASIDGRLETLERAVQYLMDKDQGEE